MSRLSRFAVCLAFLSGYIRLAAQADTIPPYMVCASFPAFTLDMNCSLVVNASDLVDSLSDNQASGLPLELGLRKLCTGTGFPENQTFLTFNASEIGGGGLELWARDASGNTSTCEIYVVIYEPGNCDPGSLVTALMPDNRGIPGVKIHAVSIYCTGDSTVWSYYPIITDAYGYWSSLGLTIGSVGANTYVTPSKKTNPTNGVTTFDLLEIQKHILGNKLLDSPYKILAADANLDGKVSLQDVVLLQKLLLGLITELPHGKSWRFVPKDFIFANPANPFPAPQQIVVPNTADPVPYEFNFIGVKIGDVNNTANPEK